MKRKMFITPVLICVLINLAYSQGQGQGQGSTCVGQPVNAWYPGTNTGDVKLCENYNKAGLGTSAPLTLLHLEGSHPAGQGTGLLYVRSLDKSLLTLEGTNDDAGIVLKNGSSVKWRLFNNADGNNLNIENGNNEAYFSVSQATGVVAVGNVENSVVTGISGERHFQVVGTGPQFQRIESIDNQVVGMDWTSNGHTWNFSKRATAEGERFSLKYNNGSSWSPAYFTALTNGNVGIGNPNPNEKLDVNGRIKTTGVRYGDGTVQTTAYTPQNGLTTSNLQANDYIKLGSNSLYITAGTAGQALPGGCTS